jgi:uncharacterized repeat protein (TIGR03803 family)
MVFVAIVVLVSSITNLHAQTFNVTYNFTGAPPDQGSPYAGLTLTPAGAFYGTTETCCDLGTYKGTVFKLEKVQNNWSFTTLYSFTDQTGSHPDAGGLTLAPGGVVYGALGYSVVTPNCPTAGCGAIFQFVPLGGICRQLPCSGETTIYYFLGDHDGSGPGGPLALSSNGRLYGVTGNGGQRNQGQAYELANSNGQWVKTNIHSFGDPGDGVRPSSALVFDSTGALYGFTGTGCEGGSVAYKLSPSQLGWSQHILHCFLRSEGYGENNVGLFDSKGNLYGTMYGGGANEEGTVFELSPVGNDWVVSRLYSFANGVPGTWVSSLIQDQAGNLYGTQNEAGKYLRGAVFKLTPTDTSWTYTTLHDFAGGPNDGEYPYAPLVFGKDDYLYGTASGGGTSSAGVIFQIIP